METQQLSILGQRCINFGINPNGTSIFELECKKWGLDPKNSSIIQLKAVQLGLPKDTTPMELKKHGVDVSGCIEILTEDDEEDFFNFSQSEFEVDMIRATLMLNPENQNLSPDEMDRLVVKEYKESLD